ncbi:hypothetical protein ACFPYI_14865 [Halomarina salina]|uniref:Uncharacterized protein n=1 Tax=Halomarina salina TaxID=1872699 RepID=A0ABD5RQE8_9EURY|nr:hypothetical protein [Halomarina salina]
MNRISPWHGDAEKFLGTGCPECGRHWLSPVRGTEQNGRVVWCSDCGFVGEVSVGEHTGDHPHVDERTDPPTITDSDVPVSDVIELYEREWTRYEIFDELDIPVEAVQDAVVWHLKQFRDEWREEGEKNLAYNLGEHGRNEQFEDWYRARALRP